MYALTLLSSRAFSRARLQASSAHSGVTVDTNAMCVPVGAQTMPLAPPTRFVMRHAFPPRTSDTQSCPPVM